MSNIPDFQVGIKLLDNRVQAGQPQYTPWMSYCRQQIFAEKKNPDTIFVSPMATDPDRYDPDMISIRLNTNPGSPVPLTDFRILFQAADQGGQGDFGPWVWTPWASERGGSSMIAFDSDQYDPDAFRIGMQIRPWPVNSPSRLNFKLGIQVYDRGETIRAPVWTNHLTRLPEDLSRDGWSDWARDADDYDPDGVIVHLYVEPVFQASGR